MMNIHDLVCSTCAKSVVTQERKAALKYSVSKAASNCSADIHAPVHCVMAWPEPMACQPYQAFAADSSFCVPLVLAVNRNSITAKML
jgi:hypothetical protein